MRWQRDLQLEEERIMADETMTMAERREAVRQMRRQSQTPENADYEDCLHERYGD